MNHSESIETNAAEGYLLGEMSDAERGAFEEHYVDCRVCSDTVHAGAAMLASGREVVKSEKTFRRVKSRTWIPASAASAAAAALIVIAGYQTVVIPRLQTLAPAQIEVMTPGPLISGTTRAGASDPVIHFEKQNPVDVRVDIPTESRFTQYRLELRAPSGKVLRAVDVSAKQAGREEGVPFLLRPLPAGRYVLVRLGVLKDGNPSEIASSIVVVQ